MVDNRAYVGTDPAMFTQKSHNQHPGVGSPHADQTVHQAGCSILEPTSITNVHKRLETQSGAELIDNFLASARNMLLLPPEGTNTDRQLFKISRRAVADIPVNASTLPRNDVFHYFLQSQDESHNTVQKRARLFPKTVSDSTRAITTFLGSKPRDPSDQKRCSHSTALLRGNLLPHSP